jgi:hypothetical protein
VADTLETGKLCFYITSKSQHNLELVEAEIKNKRYDLNESDCEALEGATIESEIIRA